MRLQGGRGRIYSYTNHKMAFSENLLFIFRLNINFEKTTPQHISSIFEFNDLFTDFFRNRHF